MSKTRVPRKATGDYAVGYCRPPTETRFSRDNPGRGGGRPRKLSPAALAGGGDLMPLRHRITLAVASEPVTVDCGGGRTRTVTRYEAAQISLWTQAAHGDVRAQRLALERAELALDCARRLEVEEAERAERQRAAELRRAELERDHEEYRLEMKRAARRKSEHARREARRRAEAAALAPPKPIEAPDAPTPDAPASDAPTANAPTPDALTADDLPTGEAPYEDRRLYEDPPRRRETRPATPPPAPPPSAPPEWAAPPTPPRRRGDPLIGPRGPLTIGGWGVNAPSS